MVVLDSMKTEPRRLSKVMGLYTPRKLPEMHEALVQTGFHDSAPQSLKAQGTDAHSKIPLPTLWLPQ